MRFPKAKYKESKRRERNLLNPLASLLLSNSTRIQMKSTNKSKIRLIFVTLLIIIKSVSAVQEGLFSSIQTLNCSSKLSLIDKEELDLLETKNMETLSLQLINGSDLISNFKNIGPNYALKLLESYKSYISNFLKPAFIVCFFLFGYILSIRRGHSLAKLPLFRAKSEIISKINSKITSAAPILLAVCLFVVFCLTLRALAIVSSQPTQSSQLYCLIKNGPKFRMNVGVSQQWIGFQEIIKMLSSKEVYFEENPFQLALFVDYRLEMEQNMRMAQFIRNSIIADKVDESYLLQLNSFILIMEQLLKIQQISKTYELKQQFQRYFSSYIEGSKILHLVHQKLFQSRIGTFFFLFQVILISLIFLTAFSLIYILIKFEQGKNSHKTYIKWIRIVIVCLAFFCFLLFSITSLIISGVYWMDTGLIRQIQNNELSQQIESIPVLSNFLLKFLPNSREVSQNARNRIQVEAGKYYQLINPIAQKSSNYYYNLFKKSTTFLNDSGKAIITAELQQKHIKESELVSQSRIARDAFYRMKTSLDSNNILNEIQFADFGRYFLKTAAQLRKITFTETYSLKKYYGYLFIALILIYFLSFISFQHVTIKSDRSKRLPQGQTFEEPNSETMNINELK